MATIEIVVDDLDGAEGAEHHTFGLDGEEFEIDLTAANHEKLIEELTPFTSVAQRVKANGEPARRAKPPVRLRRREDMKVTQVPSASPTIRAWWKAQKDENLPPHRAHGRIPESVMQAFSLSTLGLGGAGGGFQQNQLFREAQASAALDGETQSLA